MNIKGCLSHNSDIWRTPSKIMYRYLNYFDTMYISSDLL